MYAQYLDLGTAIGLAFPTGHAMATAEVGHDHYIVSRLYALIVLVYCNHLGGQLMTMDPWIAKKRLVASVRMEVGTADTYLIHFQ